MQRQKGKKANDDTTMSTGKRKCVRIKKKGVQETKTRPRRHPRKERRDAKAFRLKGDATQDDNATGNRPRRMQEKKRHKKGKAIRGGNLPTSLKKVVRESWDAYTSRRSVQLETRKEKIKS